MEWFKDIQDFLPHSLSPTHSTLHALPPFLFSPIWSQFNQNPPILSPFSLRSALLNTDVSSLLELNNRKFLQSLGAQNWRKNQSTECKHIVWIQVLHLMGYWGFWGIVMWSQILKSLIFCSLDMTRVPLSTVSSSLAPLITNTPSKRERGRVLYSVLTVFLPGNTSCSCGVTCLSEREKKT